MRTIDTGKQLLEYVNAKKAGKTYTGQLSDEARDLIRVCGSDLDWLLRQAEALHYMDHTFGG